MKIGKLTVLEEAKGVFAGEGDVRTLAFKCNFTLIAITSGPKSEDAPTHEIWARVVGTGGDRVPLGLAWQKKLERGQHKGAPFFQLTFDDPSFDAPFYVSAFPRAGQPVMGKTWDFEVVWNRKRGEGAVIAAATAGRAGIDDEIPF